MSFIVITGLAWNRPDGSNLFHNISLTCGTEKTGFTGNNGTGKSILARIITGSLSASAGNVEVNGAISYLPQSLDNFTGSTISGLFGVEKEYAAIDNILAGNGSENDYFTLNDDWELDARLQKALRRTGVEYLSPFRVFSTLSGGEQVRCVLSSLLFRVPDFLILDEPTNHLDESMRQFIYAFVQSFTGGLLVISHDRELLRLMDRIIELTPDQARVYGGNYDFYAMQKEIERDALEDDFRSAETKLEKRVNEMKVALNRQAARTKSAGKRAGHAGIPKIMMNLLEDKGEKTTAHLKRIHEKHIEEENNVVEEIKRKLPPERRMTIDFANNRLPNSKKIVTFDEVNLLLDGTKPLWKTNVSFSLIGNERLHLRGTNGSGKSSLLKLITGNLLPSTGKLYMGVSSPVLLDQDVSLLAADKSILENIIDHSRGLIPQHELRIRLARLLFYNDEVLKPVSVLSGGERMRAGLACLLASVEPPELILLDEPTNNLDLAGVLQMTKMLNSYSGPLIVVSHDKSFISDLQITREMELERDTYY